MNEEAGKHIGSGIAWFGFWLMIGLANFGEEPVVSVYDQTVEAVKSVIDGDAGNDE